MFHTALFTIDGSRTALGALPGQLRAIDPQQTEVTALQVIDSVQLVLAHTTPAGYPIYGGVDVAVAEQAVAGQRTEAESGLTTLASDLAEVGVQHVVNEVREGRPGDQIVEFVQEHGIELVVMATHGRTGLRRTVLGSVADHVLRHLDVVPLMLVHPAED